MLVSMAVLPLQAAVFSADAVKATFLYRFASFVEWPEDAPAGPLVIGVAGGDEVARQLDDLLTRVNVNGREAQVRRVSKPADLDGVHILYLGPDSLSRTRASSSGRCPFNMPSMSPLDFSPACQQRQ